MAVAANSPGLSNRNIFQETFDLGGKTEINILSTEDGSSYKIEVKKLRDLTAQELATRDLFVEVILKNATKFQLEIILTDQSLNGGPAPRLSRGETKTLRVNRRLTNVLQIIERVDVPAPSVLNGPTKKRSPTGFVAFCLGIGACLVAVFAAIAALFRCIRP